MTSKNHSGESKQSSHGSSHGSTSNHGSTTDGEKRGGPGNFAEDPQRASEAGKKGRRRSESGSDVPEDPHDQRPGRAKTDADAEGDSGHRHGGSRK
jgi:general stress protein YciG